MMNDLLGLPLPGKTRQGRILVVDDDTDMRNSLLRLLSPGWEVELAADVEAALKAAMRVQPEIILADVRMPDLDGIELIERLREVPHLKHTPVIFLTAPAGEEAGIQGLLAGAEDYIAKPFSPRDLLARIQATVERARAAAALQHSEERLRVFLDGMEEGFGILAPDFTILEHNREALRMDGRAREEIVGRSHWDVFPGSENSELGRLLKKAMAERVPVSLVHRYASEADRALWLEMRAYPISDGTLAVFWRDVTERRRVEDALHFQALLLDTVEQSIIATDLEGKIIYWNKYAEDLFGWKVEEVIGRSIVGVTTPGNNEKAKEIMSELLKGKRWSGEFTLQRRDGTAFPAYVSDVPIYNSEGNITGIVGVAVDLTERRKAEEALRESQARMQKALSTESVGVLFLRLDGRLTDANEALLKMSGYTIQELLDLEDWALLTPPEFMGVTSKAAKELAETGETAPYEKQLLRKDGSRWWGLFAPTRLSGDGLETECLEFIVDVTDLKETEEALRQQQATLQSFYDSAPFLMGIAKLEDDQIVAVSGNRAAAEFFATDPSALPGKSGSELGNAEDFERLWVEKYKRSQADGKPVQFDYEHLRPSGSRWLRATVAFIGLGPNGNPWFSFVVEDITEHKRAELALRQHQQELQLLNETLEQKVLEKTVEVRRLASEQVKITQRERQRISHILHDDLQQHIYAIRAQMTFLHDRLENEEARNEASDIERELQKVLEVTRHLSVDLSPPILREEGLAQAIEWLATRMRRQYNLAIGVRADGSFAIPDEDLHVLLFNCVRELLFNIVKHAEANQAVVALQRSGADLRIEVRDDGKGFKMPAEQDGDDAVRLSLGLSTIQHQLGMFGGRMEIKSNPGAGTRIVLSVPVPPAG